MFHSKEGCKVTLSTDRTILSRRIRKSPSSDQESFVSKQFTASHTQPESMFTLLPFETHVINKQVASSYVVVK
jgi:hypothetical protein